MRVEIINQESNVPNIINNKDNKRKVAGYARVSTDKDEQFSSYEAQIKYCTRQMIEGICELYMNKQLW